MLKKTKLQTIINHLTTEQLDLFKIKILDTEGETLLDESGVSVVKTLFAEYGEWYLVYNYPFPAWDGVQTVQQIFFDSWELFLADNLDNFRRICLAYNTDYSPLENYSMREDHTKEAAWSKDHTDTGSENIETDIHSDTTDTTTIDNQNPLTTTDYATTYDDTTTDRKTGSSVSQGSTSVRRSTADDDNGVAKNRTKTTRSYDEHGYSESGTDDITSETTTRSGNIGVQMSQTMLQAELDVRKFQILKYIIDMYAKNVLILSGGDDDDC